MRGKRRIHAPFRAPCSSVLFSLHSARTNFARVPVPPPLLLLLTSSGVPRFSSLSLSLSARCRRRHSLPLPPRQFLLFVWLAAAKRKDTKRKRAELARSPLIPILHLSPARSHSVFSSVVLALSSAAALLLLLSLPLLFLALAAARWFVNAKFKLSRATLLHEPLCDANEGTNTSTLSKSPREPPPPLQTPKRAYQ